MKKLLLAIAIVATLFSSCKKDEQENPQPTPAPTHQILLNVTPSIEVTTIGDVKYVDYMPPTGWKIDSINLSATPPLGTNPMYEDYFIYDNPPTVLLFDNTINTESMYNKWIAIPDSIDDMRVILFPDNVWNSLDISISKR